jgi:hypothetical protein
MVDFVSETIEEHVQAADVEESALRVAAQKHEDSHGDDGNHVTISEESRPQLSEEEEQVISEIVKQDGKLDDPEYKRIDAEQASGSYGSASADDAAKYGGGHGGHQEASCTCGWRADPGDAMKQMFGADKTATGVKYTSDSDDGGAGGYNSKSSIDDVAGGYSSPGDPGQGGYHT